MFEAPWIVLTTRGTLEHTPFERSNRNWRTHSEDIKTETKTSGKPLGSWLLYGSQAPPLSADGTWAKTKSESARLKHFSITDFLSSQVVPYVFLSIHSSHLFVLSQLLGAIKGRGHRVWQLGSAGNRAGWCWGRNSTTDHCYTDSGTA